MSRADKEMLPSSSWPENADELLQRGERLADNLRERLKGIERLRPEDWHWRIEHG